MGKIFNNKTDIYNMVEENFGKSENYLVALKHNGFLKGILKLFLSRLYYVMDGCRSYVLYFDEKGMHEKEISLSDKGPFLLIPWREIKEFRVKDKGNKVYLDVNHLGKTYSYEIDFRGRLLAGNRERFLVLREHNFYREEE